MTPEKHRHSALVASHIPGRLRVKLAASSRGAHFMTRIKEQLADVKGVDSVDLNHTTWSITVRYDRGKQTVDGIHQVLEDMDVVLVNLTNAPSIGEGGKESVTFIAAVEDLNRRLSGAAGINIDLKTFLPLTLLAAGAWAIAREGLKIWQVPAWAFLWLAFDTFVKLHPAAPVKN